ncbi:MAG: 50S ribosome-binding GTPase [Candidatus Altiarchaeota archaeon]|nr:50S ribosome-binding GTPase [Candidatus Altiarchaeota archaeon]
MPYRLLIKWIMKMFRLRRNVRLGIYGPPNTGKTSLANRIISDFIGEGEWQVSPLPHETRKIQKFKEIVLKSESGKTLEIDMFDMPGIQSHKELHTDALEEFFDAGLSNEDATKRLIDATDGIAEAIRWMSRIDSAVVVLDSTQSPHTKVNALLLGVLKAHKVKVVIVANKIDLPNAKPDDIKKALPNYHVVEISLKEGTNIYKLYEAVTHHLK